MANQVREYTVTVAPGAGTPTAPVTTPLPLPDGYVVTQVELAIPPGPRGTVGLALAVGGEQVLPFERGQYVVDDDAHVVWPLSAMPTAGSWSVLAWSTGTYPHTIRVLLLVTVPGLEQPQAPPTTTIPTTALSGTVSPGTATAPSVTVPTVHAVTVPTAPSVTVPTVPSVTVPTVPSVTVPAAATPAPVLTLSVISSTTVTVGEPTTVTVEAYTTGIGPVPPSIALSGTLPAGLTFNTRGDGSAVITGTATPTDLGQWPLTVTASQTGAKPVSTGVTLTVVVPTPVGDYVQAPTSRTRTWGRQTYYPTATLAAAVAALNAGHPVWFWTASATQPAPVPSAAQLLAVEHTGSRTFPQYVTYVGTRALAGTPSAPAPSGTPRPLGQWVVAPTRGTRSASGITYVPITTYDEAIALAATPTTVYLWTRVLNIPSLPQTQASLRAWEHTGDHAYTQYVTYRRA